jgi:hypothetical protein
MYQHARMGLIHTMGVLGGGYCALQIGDAIILLASATHPMIVRLIGNINTYLFARFMFV